MGAFSCGNPLEWIVGISDKLSLVSHYEATHRSESVLNLNWLSQGDALPVSDWLGASFRLTHKVG